METVTSQPPMLSYKPSEGQDEEGRTHGASKTEKVLNGITWGILSVVLALWAVVGALFWIPLLIRAMLRFSISLIEASFEGQKPVEAARVLKNAVSFYRRGFVVAVEAVTGKGTDERESGPTTENRLLMEVLWALLVWYFIALFLGWIQASPVDLWDWLVSIPWGEHFSDLVQRFRV